MLSLEEFIITYANEIDEFRLTNQEILENYNIYLEDPLQFTGGMIQNYAL